MRDNYRTLIILPAYNEEACLAIVIDKVQECVKNADILVVNDGSNDNTSSIAHASGVNVIDLPFNLGIGGAMQTGYLYAYRNRYDIAIQLDADGQHNPAFVDSLIAPLLNDSCDMVIGSRYVRASLYRPPLLRKIGMVFFSKLVSKLVNQNVKDTTSGFRAVNRKIIDFFAKDYPSDFPEVDVLVRLYKKNFRFCEIPVEMSARQGGNSSINLPRSIYYMLKVSLALLINLIRPA